MMVTVFCPKCGVQIPSESVHIVTWDPAWRLLRDLLVNSSAPLRSFYWKRALNTAINACAGHHLGENLFLTDSF